jgi:hypothetical protein
LPATGRLAGLEDLARHVLPPAEREAVARAFGVMFGAVAAAFALGLAVFSRIEDRMLRDRSAVAAPTSE